MFKNKAVIKAAEEITSSSTIVGKGTSMKGDVQTMGNIRIEGKVIGTIQSKSKVVIGQSSLVEGNIHSPNAEIAGEIKGDLEITGCLVLKPTAVIHGDIFTKELLVESGAKFNGVCNMQLVAKEVQLNKEDMTKQHNYTSTKIAS